MLMQYIRSEDKADQRGAGHSASAGAYGRRCIASEGGRGASRRQEVEGDHVDEDIGSLQICLLECT